MVQLIRSSDEARHLGWAVNSSNKDFSENSAVRFVYKPQLVWEQDLAKQPRLITTAKRTDNLRTTVSFLFDAVQIGVNEGDADASSFTKSINSVIKVSENALGGLQDASVHSQNRKNRNSSYAEQLRCLFKCTQYKQRASHWLPKPATAKGKV